MAHTKTRAGLGVGCLLAGCGLLAAQQINLSEYRTAENAATATIKPAAANTLVHTGYFGASVLRNAQGRLAVEEVQPGSPAAAAGLKKGDIVTRVGDHGVRTTDAFREWLQSAGPGEAVKITLQRDDRSIDVSATLAAISRPMRLGMAPTFFGADLGESKEGQGVEVAQVTPGSPAATAGLKVGDYIHKLEGADFTRPGRLGDILLEKKPGDALTISVRREGQEIALKAILVAEAGRGGRGRGAGRGGAGGDRGNPPGGDRGNPPGGGAGRGNPGGRGGRGGAGGRAGGPPTTMWKKDAYRLAVVGIEFPDIKHNAKVSTHDWEEAFFSRGLYANKSNPTGQEIHGSLNDYLQEQSYGGLRLEGKVFDWVTVGKKRAEYIQGSGTSNKTAVLAEALGKVTERDGKDAFKGFDGLLFVYAGDRQRTNAGAVYYPHAGSVGLQNENHPYFLNCEGASRMTPVGAFAKEFGRLLGLPDLAARPESVGSEGLGVWCAMSDPFGTGRPQQFSAWCKEKLGWLKPVVIDPTVRQKLILAPVEDSPRECYKVLVRPDGSEYFLLENRRKKGFDSDLPAEGLLVWRVVNDRPLLEESHGVEGPTGPTVHLSAVPFPSAVNNSFTPDTSPSSRSPQGGGLPVYVTEIQRLPDGRIAFQIGYEYH